MKHEQKIDIDPIRTDTTVTECNIHYPTDSSLLWNVYRVTERHKGIFGEKVKNLATDMGFRPAEDDREDWGEEVAYLAVPKCLSNLGDATLRMYQCFRAGKVVELEIAPTVSHVTIQKTLKKTR